MKIFWSDFAVRMLSEIHKYYKSKASLKVANGIKSSIFQSVHQLEKHPESGQLEDNLSSLNQEHRFLLSSN